MRKKIGLWADPNPVPLWNGEGGKISSVVPLEVFILTILKK